MDITLDYIGIGVNRVVNALAWGEHGGVAYAAHHMIALYDIESAKVVSTICGHTGMVNCVHWVPREVTPELPPSQHLLLSGAADNTVSCWLVTYPPSAQPSGGSETSTAAAATPSWRRLAVLHGHSAPVTSVAIHRLPNSSSPATAQAGPAAVTPGGIRLLLVSTAGDADVLVWACGGGSSGGGSGSGNGGGNSPGGGGGANGSASYSGAEAFKEAAAEASASAATTSQPVAESEAASALYGQGQWRLDQRLHVGTRMQTTAALTALPLDPDWTLLAMGGTDRKVSLYVRPPDVSLGPAAGRFSLACVLEGPENWVRGVAFCCCSDGGGGAGGEEEGEARSGGSSGAAVLLLASVSQDRYGRIWKLQPEPLMGTATAAAATGFPSEQRELPLAALIQRYAPKHHVDTDKTRYRASCEALLIGHEDWVHGMQWAPPPPPSNPEAEDAQVGQTTAGSAAVGQRQRRYGTHTRTSAALLTASMDRTMVIWRYESTSGLWMNEVALGDAGASCLGYFGGVWGPGGTAILAHGFTGALHLWQQPTAASAGPRGPWIPRHALGGHFGAVVDVGWGLDGGCVLSVSEDQTARVHAGVMWRRGQEREDGQEPVEERQRQQQLHWCEVARAQIHGHDFRCVAPVPTPAGCHYMYVSGSEEKVLRVLEAPQAFIDTLVALRGGEDSPAGRVIREEGRRGAGFGAAVAALGLSNKAVDEVDAAAAGEGGGNAGVGGGRPGGEFTDGPDFVPCAAPQVVREPPLEEHLAQNTLWPETHKLYGHGNDVFCAAASPDGRYLASACKAQTASTAAIWVWCTRTWRAIAQLRAHTLTVTQLEWSPSSCLLAAVSRDRTFSIFRCRSQRMDSPTASTAEQQQQQQVNAAAAESSSGGGGYDTFELVCRVKGAHGRVIWSVSWSLDEQLLATASRDETVKVWRTGQVAEGGGRGGGGEAPAPAPAVALAATLPQFPCAATAVAFAPCPPTAASSAGTGSGDCRLEVGSCAAKRGAYVLAVGLEDGSVQVWQLAAAAGGVDDRSQGPTALVASCLWSAGEPWRHVAAVRRLRWRGAPGTGTAVQEGEAAAEAGGDGELQLASGSEDHSVRVFTLRGMRL